MNMRTAINNDIPALTQLINSAYRGDTSRLGWTTEADLLSGIRSDEHDLELILKDPSSLLLLAEENTCILACIHAHHENESVHLGLFAVHPMEQNKGIGKTLLHYAEKRAQETWEVQKACMGVISYRFELIEYYRRRGYDDTGQKIAFPKSVQWQELVDGLQLSVLEKDLT